MKKGSAAEARPKNSGLGVSRKTSSPQTTVSFPIVGIGASAGGLEALEQFLGRVPAGSGMAFVIVQHLDPTLADDVREVLRTLAATEKPAAARDGRWFTVRIMPYRTLDDRIDGVVITLHGHYRGQDAGGAVADETGRLGEAGHGSIHRAGPAGAATVSRNQ